MRATPRPSPCRGCGCAHQQPSPAAPEPAACRRSSAREVDLDCALVLSPSSGSRMSEITRAEVAHLARLARLALADDELDRLASELDVILGAVAKIGEVSDAEGVQPMTHAVPIENVMR